MRDPWDPLATGDEARHPDGGYVHPQDPDYPELARSDEDYYADRAARREEAAQLGWDR